MRKNPVMSFLLIPVFLLIISPLILLSLAAPAHATEYMKNGDFSQGLLNYTEVTVSAGSFSGFPRFNVPTTAACLPSQSGNPFLAINVPGNADGYVEQTVVLPAIATTLTFRSWGNEDPCTATVSVVTVSDNTEHVLEMYTPPQLEAGLPACSGKIPVTKSYNLAAFAGQTVKVRLRATATGYNGTIADFDDLSITDGGNPAAYSGPVLFGPVNPAVAGPPPCTAGDPVNCVTGNLVETAADFVVPGRGPALRFVRTFNGLDAASASAPGALGFGWNHSYAAYLTRDDSGNVTVHQGNGSTVYFEATGDSFTPPLFVIATLTKNGDGTYTFTLPDQRSEIFSATGALVAETDRNGYRTSLSYNTAGRLITVTDPAGRKLSFKYGKNGLISTITDPINRKVTYGYDSARNLISVKDAGGNITRFTYDSGHRLTALTDAKGGRATNIYDSSNRVVSQTDPAGRTLTFAYDSGTTTVTDGNGNKVVYVHSGNRLTSLTRGYGTADAATSTFAYDAQGNRTSVNDPNGNVWSATYDARGNRLTSVDPLGGTIAFTYDAQNNLLTRTDAMGFTTTFSYDAHGNLIGVSRPLNGTPKTLTFGYDDDSSRPGDLTTVIDSDGHMWSLAYDEYGNVIRRVDPNGGTWTGSYNRLGRLTAAVGPRGNAPGADPGQFQTQRTYSKTGDLIRVTDPLKHSKTFAYDKNRNLSTVRDANGHTLRFTYNADNQVISVKRPDGNVWTNTYDAAGNLTGQSDGHGATTAYAYDSLNRRVQVTDPMGRVTRFSYDLSGNRVGMEDAGGKTSTFVYDAANRLATISYSDMTATAVSLAYDVNGRRTSMTDGTGTTTYQWDSLGRLTGSTDGAGRQVSYGYDLRGHLTDLTYPTGKKVTRTFDSAGRLTSMQDWLGNISTFQYDASGNLTGIGYGNGASAAFAYDRTDRVSQIAYSNGAQAFLSFAYHRNSIGQVSSEAMGNEKYTYSYTKTNQLKTVNKSTFSVDPADNLVQLENSVLSYDVANEPLNMAGSDGSWSFSYDANGNRVQATGQTTNKTYGYDHANRLTAFGADASYSYNGDGLRMSKSVGGVSRAFAWNIAHPLPLLLADGDIQFIYGPNGRPLEQINADGSVYWYHQDQLGSTRAMTDESGISTAPYRYTPFGKFLPDTPGQQPATPLLFAGQYTDAESGLQYLRARYYDPATGQFLTRDPLVSITRQPYLYANGDPVNRTDPTGKDQVVIVVNPGTYSVGTSSSVSNDSGSDVTSNQLVNGVGQTPHVGIYGGPSSPEYQACAAQGALGAAGITSPETSTEFHPYGDNPVSYTVTQNVHVSGDASNPNAVAIVTSTVVDAQGNVVYHNQVTGVVGQNYALTSDLMQQGGANVNGFIQGVLPPSQGAEE